MQNLKYFFQLVRWPNLLLLSANQCLVFIFLLEQKFNSGYLKYSIILLFGTVLITAAGYIINDYHDQKIDFINKPERLIIDKYISRRKSLLFYFLLNFISLSLGFWFSIKIGLIFLLCVILLWLYAVWLKRVAFLGNLVVSFLTSFSLILLAIVFNKNNELIYFYSFFAFGLTLVREIVKDCEDIIGDQQLGCKTLPIIFGFKNTKSMLIIVLILNILSILLFSNRLNNNTLTSIFYFIVLLLAINSYQIGKAHQKTDWKNISTFLKIIMFIGVLSMVLV